MEPLSQFFLRHREQLLTAGPTLWFNPPADLPWQQFAGADACQWQTQDEMARRRLAATGLPVDLHALPSGSDRFATIVLSLPREKARLRMLAAALADRLLDGGSLLVAGELKGGGRSAAKQLEPLFTQVAKADNARHCVMHRAQQPVPRERFSVKEFRSSWTLEGAHGPPLTVVSYPGVFAHGALDPGTGLLLEHLNKLGLQGMDEAAESADTQPGVRQKALDLGCGAGVIGASLLRAVPGLDVDMADSNAMALAASRETLKANGLTARVIASDGLSAINDRYDLLISNPPFHDGHREREDLGAGLFAGAGNFLNPGGQLVLVVNRHLPWRRWMQKALGEHKVLASNSAYHVLVYRKNNSPELRPQRRSR